MILVPILSTAGDIKDAFRIGENYLDTLVWPAVAAAFLLLFRRNIAQLIDRIQKGKGPGFEFDSPTQPPPPRPPPLGAAMAGEQQWQLLWYYERMYRIIHGTQIQMLLFFGIQSEGAAAEQLVPFFIEHLNRVRNMGFQPVQDWDSYFGFMVGSGLIEPVPESSGRYRVSEVGRNFLAWMTNEGISGAKLL